MKTKSICLAIFLLQASVLCDTLSFNSHKFIYELPNQWKVSASKVDSGYLDKWYKREEIKDSKGIQVIPNLELKLINIISPATYEANPKESNIAIFTKLCLANYAPSEVMEDYIKSFKQKNNYHTPFKEFYIFNSPYSDNLNCKHTCLYVTIYDAQKHGVFIVIDSTEEIYKKIESEITAFLNSIKML